MMALDKNANVVLTSGFLAVVNEGTAYVIREIDSGRAVVGGRFSTRKAAQAALALFASGYELEQPYWPMSDAPVLAPEIADDATLKARWTASQRDRYLMSGRGFNEED